MFFIASIFGFVFESILSYFQFGYVINKQELVFGPFMPVYGIGAIFLFYISKHVKSYTMIFILSFFIGSFVEFFYSLLQENIFGTLSWDYSSAPLNIQGRITLIYSIGWGSLGLISCKLIFPNIEKFIYNFPKTPAFVTTWILIIFMIFNISVSIIALYRQKQRYFDIPPSNILSRIIDKYYPDKKMDKIFENQKKLYVVQSTFSN
jgi:uncharacterized membrane protein